MFYSYQTKTVGLKIEDTCAPLLAQHCWMMCSANCQGWPWGYILFRGIEIDELNNSSLACSAAVLEAWCHKLLGQRGLGHSFLSASSGPHFDRAPGS